MFVGFTNLLVFVVAFVKTRRSEKNKKKFQAHDTINFLSFQINIKRYCTNYTHCGPSKSMLRKIISRVVFYHRVCTPAVYISCDMKIVSILKCTCCLFVLYTRNVT